MVIVFLCGSLEPGKDGVGDYCRRLARHLQLNGHLIGLLALYDKFIEEIYDGIQQDNNVEIPVLRLPYNLEGKKRMYVASKWISSINPEWLSLQYVVFAFHNKGLPFNLIQQLAYLGKGRKWHIMFHEIWIGINKEVSPKFKVLGFCQKILIKLMVKKLCPQSIHTNCGLYQIYLKSCGITVNQLPLFSNVPVLPDEIDVSNRCLSSIRNISLVIFGPIHCEASQAVQDLAEEAVAFEFKFKKKIALQLIGRTGSKTESWISIFNRAGLETKNYGEQPVDMISKVLKDATIGISTTPLALIEKSGTASAMREHGLPVLCVSHIWTPTKKNTAPPVNNVLNYTRGKLEFMLLNIKKDTSPAGIGEVAKQFTNSLVEATHKSF